MVKCCDPLKKKCSKVSTRNLNKQLISVLQKVRKNSSFTILDVICDTCRMCILRKDHKKTKQNVSEKPQDKAHITYVASSVRRSTSRIFESQDSPEQLLLNTINNILMCIGEPENKIMSIKDICNQKQKEKIYNQLCQSIAKNVFQFPESPHSIKTCKTAKNIKTAYDQCKMYGEKLKLLTLLPAEEKNADIETFFVSNK